MTSATAILTIHHDGIMFFIRNFFSSITIYSSELAQTLKLGFVWVVHHQ